jgi:hypothetical protein
VSQNTAYQAEAAQRWPDQYQVSQLNLSKLTSDQQRQLFDQGKLITAQVAQLFLAGNQATDTSVQGLIAQHHAWVCNFWTPNATAYAGLGEMYVNDERFTAYYDDFATGLAPFMSAAMASYAANNLTD